MLLGWGIVHWTAVKRGRRQEDLATVDAIETRIVALRSQAVGYYTKAAGEVLISGATIRLELRSIAEAIDALRQSCKKRHYDLESEIMYLRQAITDDPFDSSNRAPLAHDDPIIQNIWLAADRLIVCLKQEFAKAHRRF